MLGQRYSTGGKGIRYRKHPTRKQGVRFDRCYISRFRANRQRAEEGFGREYEGCPLEKAVSELHALGTAAKTGSGPARMVEKRKLAEKEKEEWASIERQAITFDGLVQDQYLTLQDGNKFPRSLAREKSLLSKPIANRSVSSHRTLSVYSAAFAD